jgi:hypothetical protein
MELLPLAVKLDVYVYVARIQGTVCLRATSNCAPSQTSRSHKPTTWVAIHTPPLCSCFPIAAPLVIPQLVFEFATYPEKTWSFGLTHDNLDIDLKCTCKPIRWRIRGGWATGAPPIPHPYRRLNLSLAHPRGFFHSF